jgi:hypothetical protein
MKLRRTFRFAAAAAIACLAVPLVGAQAPPGSRLAFYERFVAIDGACAWPNLNLLPDGRLAVLIWPLPNHGVTEGAAETWVSGDGGATWSRAGVPVPNEPGSNRMNVAAGVVGEDLLTLVGGWSRRQPYQPGRSMGSEGAEARARAGAVTIGPRAAVSRDAGRNWTLLPDPALPLRPGGRALVPFGKVDRLTGGEIGVCLYGDGVFFFTSADGGRTWERRGTIVSEPDTHNEATWVQLAGGDLYAAVRTYGDQRLEGFRSSDGGRSWRREAALTMPLQIPGDLLRLQDGHVLLTYGARNRGLFGVWVQRGDPGLRSWSAPVLLVDLQGSSELQHVPAPSADGGYPSTVQLSDGTFVTAYYSRGVPTHQRYHVGVVRWRLSKDGLPLLVPARP